MKKQLMRFSALIIALTAVLSAGSVSAKSSVTTESYYEFRQENSLAGYPENEILIDTENFTASDEANASVGEVCGEQNILKTGDRGYVEWTFEAPAAGLYNIEISYCPLEGKGNTIKRNIYINGEIQYSALSAVSFHRVYANESGEIKTDSQGNELRPVQVESPRFETVTLYSSEYNAAEPLSVLLKQGTNTLRFEAVSEPMAIRSIKFYRKNAEASYSEVSKTYPKESEAELIHIEGEDASYKSEKSLYPICDTSSGQNSPQSLSKTVMNMIGGSNWNSPLEYIEWELEVKGTGLYKICIRGKQDFTPGQLSSRRLYIDGEVPFKEANDLKFDYGIGFQTFVLGEDGTEYLFYLEEGKHTIRLENGVGSVGAILERLSLTVAELNSVYQQVFMITGAYPDADRDYNIALSLPELEEKISELSGELENLKEEYLGMTGEKGTGYSQMDKVQVQLKSFIEDIEELPARLDTFRTNISNLSSWLLEAVNQPLTIDYIEIVPSDEETKNADSGIIGRFIYGVKKFFVSFAVDYNSINLSEDTEEEITLWLGTGRDQAQALKTVVTNDFTPQTGIGVNIRLVDINVLLPAVAVGYGPDVAISLDRSLTMNYAYRGAVQALNGFDGFEEVLGRFPESALTELKYRDTYYGLPDKYTFYMMFYRKDILAELGAEVPETWDDIYTLLPKLQNSHMTVGFPNISDNVIDMFTTLLYQNGGTVYDDGLNKCVLDAAPALTAFKQFTDFYTKYGVYQKIDQLTYFRTGQTPIVMMPYTFFANIEAGAPEISGMWGFTLMPGTVGEDGTVNHTSSGSATGCCIFSNSKHKDASWKFLEWWTGEEAQTEYGNEIESIQGTSGRYASANMNAVSNLAWSNEELEKILTQAEASQAMAEAPGGYMTGRYVVTAALTVVNNGLTARETIMDYTKTINNEVEAMRKEFGLDD